MLNIKDYLYKSLKNLLVNNKGEKYKMRKIITSESVNCGHPDKTCDIIADSFLDAALSQDKDCQMAVECAIKDNKLMIYGESTTTAKINYEEIAKRVLKDIGYTNDFEFVKTLSGYLFVSGIIHDLLEIISLNVGFFMQ
jgi:S-adenosylmethionine synthetase